jgi:hypothetical protein
LFALRAIARNRDHEEASMSTFFARVATTSAGDPRPGEGPVAFDVGRTLAVVILGGLLIVGAVVLYVLDEDAGATGLLSLGEAVIFGGLGIAAGEKNGIEAARSAPPDDRA